VRAYVLIQAEEKTESLAHKLRAIPGVVAVEDVRGAYDAIAVARSSSMRHLTDVVLGAIRKLPGVVRALPAPLLDSSEDDPEADPSDRASGEYRAA
jgi:DNA-binding Lrp family transcriptional regulator